MYFNKLFIGDLNEQGVKELQYGGKIESLLEKFSLKNDGMET